MYSDLSRRVSWTLDKLGYSAHQREIRRYAYKCSDKNSQQMNVPGFPFIEITVGSKGEGVTNFYESDRDILFVDRKAIVFEVFLPEFLSIIPEDVTILRFVSAACYPGHTFLEIVRLGTNPDKHLTNAIWKYDDRIFLSSCKFMEHHKQVITELQNENPGSAAHGIAGPSAPFSQGGRDSDLVFVVPCYCPITLSDWLHRPRQHKWPNQELLEKVSQMPAYAAATGFSESETRGIEWRMCFNTGEIELFKNLNDIQTKLYILLKIVLKQILKPQRKEVTSYVMKNIVFWLAENHPQEDFNEDTLLAWLIKALRVLKRSVEKGMLPYYMIPSRNLFAGKMDCIQKARMLRRVRVLLKTGPQMLFKCKKLKNAILVIEPECLNSIGRNRDELEVLQLISVNIKELLRSRKPDQTDEELHELMVRSTWLRQIGLRIFDILFTDWKKMAKDGYDIGMLVDLHMKQLLC